MNRRFADFSDAEQEIIRAMVTILAETIPPAIAETERQIPLGFAIDRQSYIVGFVCAASLSRGYTPDIMLGDPDLLEILGLD